MGVSGIAYVARDGARAFRMMVWRVAVNQLPGGGGSEREKNHQESIGFFSVMLGKEQGKGEKLIQHE